jgi:CubicO group peptidase (beta-lactamase class C family)
MDIAAIHAYLQERTAADAFSGVVRIDRGDEVLLEEGYGLASRTWRAPCRPETRFDTASITKLFTAVAVLQQVEAGAFDLDTSTVDYLELRGTEISPAVTPYHLLTHTSGIADNADEEAEEDYAALFVDTPNYSFVDTADHLSTFVHRPPNFAPGEGCRYCNSSYLLLGLMVERATGSSYRDYVTAKVFEPAGMHHSGFFRMDQIEPDVAEGADPVLDPDGTVTGWRRNIYSYPPIGSPDGGAHVTAGDLLSFHRALVGHRLLGADLTTAMLTPKEDYRKTETGLQRTGFGFMFEVAPTGEVVFYWKEGINAGASGILSRSPAIDVTYVVLSNLESGAWEPIETIDRMLGGSQEPGV